MTYQVLARKWRPQDFAAIIGQEPIVTALRHALAEDRIAQAYLFSGIRGVGKTTAARVMAKALNCETRRQKTGSDPCNACPSCQQITGGHDLDVIEIDAATYSKVEQVRELTESLRYAPANDRYKVVVLDEVHRLSRQAFDALLKIVEEPPPHLVFIFATTEIDAVPATILSRCQQFAFRRVPAKILSTYLRTLADRESITASDATLRLIARAGEGSVRDAVALLDQLATFGKGTVSEQDAGRLVGGLDHGQLQRLLEAILGGHRRRVGQQIAEIDALGLDPASVYGHLVAYVRDALHLALGEDMDGVDLAPDEARALGALGREAGYENLLRLLNLLLASEDTVRRSELGALALEITCLRAAELPKLTALEALLRGQAAQQHQASAPVPPRAPSTDQPASTPLAAPVPLPSPGAATVDALLEMLAARRPPLAARLRRAQALELDDRGLLVTPARGDTELERALEKKTNDSLLRDLLGALLAKPATWRIGRPAAPGSRVTAMPGDSRPGEIRPTPAPKDAAPTARKDRSAVQTVLDVFDGSTVERREAAKP